MHPPLIMLMRMCRTDLVVKCEEEEGKTYTVPKGSVVAVSPSVHQRLPTLFKEPNTFDPDRFAGM
jgi:sterol 14-demethylase